MVDVSKDQAVGKERGNIALDVAHMVGMLAYRLTANAEEDTATNGIGMASS